METATNTKENFLILIRADTFLYHSGLSLKSPPQKLLPTLVNIDLSPHNPVTLYFPIYCLFSTS